LSDAAAALFGEPAPEMHPDLEHYDIQFESQGQDAYEMVQQSLQDEVPFALAFVDVRMPPGWDGIQTASRMLDTAPFLQIVICTAYSDYSFEEMISQLGWTDRVLILKKPYDCCEVRLLALSLTEKWQLARSAFSLLHSLAGEPV
jgi:DNA-binding LytR/AlgR family response regulator